MCTWLRMIFVKTRNKEMLMKLSPITLFSKTFADSSVTLVGN